MRHVADYRQVIEHKLLKELKGRKQTIAPIPDAIMEQLYALFLKGAVIDFEMSFDTGVMIYPTGEIQKMDEIHKLLDRLRMGRYGLSLGYDRRAKRWEAGRGLQRASW